MTTIVKLQIPLYTNGQHLALVYNKDKTIQGQVPVTKEIKKEMGTAYKLFFHAEYDDKTQEIVIGKRAPWQEW